MTSTTLPAQGLVFWPVGTGDSTTIVIDDEHVIQVDLHDLQSASDDDAVVAAVVDRLVEVLPTREGKPYLAGFILTHADEDHCLGFADLLDRVTIGEIWATPRLWREYTEHDLELCSDGKAFHEEVLRRVEATLDAIAAGREPASGDRIRVVGYDTDEGAFTYHDLPAECLSYPGHVVGAIDGDDVTEHFEAFIHAPFKDDCAAERNDTSLALQVTLRDGAGAEGHVLLLGDLGYETITKLVEQSEHAERSERLAWEVLLAPHHCSRKVMYVHEDGNDVLKQDVLDALERHASESAVVVASSRPFPPRNKSGDNPPHVVARARYEEIASEVICTGEYPEPDAPHPVVFRVADDGLERFEPDAEMAEAATKAAGSRAGGLAFASAAAILVGLGAPGALRWLHRQRPGGGLADVRDAVTRARGDAAAPQQPVGFGRR